MSLGPFDLNGSDFIALYSLLFLPVAAFGFILPRLFRPAGRSQSLDDPEQLAVLAGGVNRLAETATARLMAGGALMATVTAGFAVVDRSAARTMVEKAIVQRSDPAKWSTIIARAQTAARPIGDRLVAMGLWLDERETRHLRWIQTMPYWLLLGFGAIKWMIGVSRDRPVGILSFFLVFTAICAAIRWFTVDRRTAAAIRTVAEARAVRTRLRAAPMREETGLAVALFGTAVLAGSPYDMLHRLRATDGGDGGMSSDGGSGCGSGGCGGGCGGCGS